MPTFYDGGDRYDLEFDQTDGRSINHTASIGWWIGYEEDDASPVRTVEMPRKAAITLATVILRRFAPERLATDYRSVDAAPMVVDFPKRRTV